MRGLTFAGVEKVAFLDVPDPGLQDPGDVLVRVERTAICGSDLHVYHGREAGIDAGTVLGHEFVGRVEAVGAGVEGLRPGDPVCCPFTTSCGECFYCRRGLTARCPSGQLLGWVEAGEGLQGAQAEAIRVPLATSTLVPIPPAVDPDLALLLGDILSTAFFCADGAEVGPGGTYVVVGCGPVGILAVLAARRRGAERVFAVDRVPDRLERAGAFGAEPLHLDDDPVGHVHAATGGRGADGALEVVGSPAATRLAVDLVRPGGIVSAAGVHTEASFAFAPGEAYDRNLTYRAGRCSVRAYLDRLLPLATAELAEAVSIISHRLPLEQGAEAYEMFARRAPGCTKIVLTP